MGKLLDNFGREIDEQEWMDQQYTDDIYEDEDDTETEVERPVFSGLVYYNAWRNKHGKYK